jgi:hypothetical protein
MDWILQGSNGFEIEKGVRPEHDLSLLVYVGVGFLILLFVVLVIHFLILAYFQLRKSEQDWEHLEELIKKYGLSNEEAGFLRKKLRKLGYHRPSVVLIKKAEFEAFFRRVLRRRNHHAEYLLQMVRKKVFDTRPGAAASSPH